MLKSRRAKRNAKWSAYGLAVAFCIYRIATFTPQPLDAPNTLRPILNKWFVAFIRLYQQPETAYAYWRTFCLLAMLVPPLLAILNYAREHRRFNFPDRAMKIVCSRALLFASIAVSLIVCRYPTLLAYQLNPDEGQFLSGAHKLFYDGNFFHSVDCGTSGPINIYPLMLPAIAGISPDFASSRVIVLLIVFFVICLLYRTLRLLTLDSVARIAILPLAGAFASFKTPNLVHYSSEHIPLLLISAALYASVRVIRDTTAHGAELFLLGLLTSAAFFSKMQSVPIVMALAAVAIAYTYAAGKAGKFWRPGLLYSAGTLSLLLLNAILCLASGVLRDFWISYIVSNQRYADQGYFFQALPRFLNYLVAPDEVRFFLFTFLALAAVYAMHRLRGNAGEQQALVQFVVVSAVVIAALMASQYSDASAIYSYLGLMAMVSIPVYFLLFYRREVLGIDPVRWLGFLATFSTLAALFSVYRPHRTFHHYLLFLFTPVSVAMAWMLIRQTGGFGPADRTVANGQGENRSRASRQSPFLLLFVVLSVTEQTYLWGSQDDHNFEYVVPTIRPSEGDLIRALTSPGGRIFVWGWTTDPYLGSGRVAATRDLNLFSFFLAPPEITSYYRTRFVHDLRESSAELFVDAVGPTSFVFWDHNLYNFEQIPEIALAVSMNYVHLIDAYGHRYFLRRDLAQRAHSVRMPRNCLPGALRCVDTPAFVITNWAATVPGVPNLPTVQMPAHALIEAEFTPMARQTENSTVFNSEAVSGSFRGFRFQSIGGDRYRLILGLGNTWAFSKSFLLPQGKAASLSIEFNGNNVYIRSNGVGVDDMHLPSPMTDAAGPITVGSWIGGQCRFTGMIRFFQIVDLEKSK